MKKFLSLLLALTLVLSLVVVPARANNDPPADPTATLTISGPTTAKEGDTVNYSAALSVSYDGHSYTLSDSKIKNVVWSWGGINEATNNAATYSGMAGSDNLTITCSVSFTFAKPAPTEGAPNHTEDVAMNATATSVSVDVTSKAEEANAAFKTAVAGLIQYAGRSTSLSGNKITAYKYSSDATPTWTLSADHIGTTYTSIAISGTPATTGTGTITVTGTKAGDTKTAVTAEFNTEVKTAAFSIKSDISTVIAGGEVVFGVVDGATLPSGLTYEWKYGDNKALEGTALASAAPTWKVPSTLTASNYTVTCTAKSGSTVVATATNSLSITVVADNFALYPTTLTAISIPSSQSTNLPDVKLYSKNGNNQGNAIDGLTYTWSCASSAITINNVASPKTATASASASGSYVLTVTTKYQGKTYTKALTLSVTNLSTTLTSVANGSSQNYYLKAAAASAIAALPQVSGTVTVSSIRVKTLPTLGSLNTTQINAQNGYVTYTAPKSSLGQDKFVATVETVGKGTFEVTFVIPVIPIYNQTFEAQYPQAVSSVGNSYNYTVTPPTGYDRIALITKGMTPTTAQLTTAPAYNSTSITLNSSDFNTTTGKCTLYVMAWNSSWTSSYNSGKYYYGPLEVYQKNYNIQYNGVVGETVQFAQSDFTDFMNEVAEARGDASKTKSYPYVTFDYVTFSLPTTAQGTLYYGGTAMSTSNSSGAFNTRTKVTNLDSVTFVPNAKTTAKTITLNFTLYATRYSSSSTSHGTTVPYSGSVVVNLVREDIKYTVSQGDSVRFDESDFLNYLRSTKGYTSNYTIDYVTFDQSAVSAVNEGSLYTYYNGYNYGGSVKTTDKFYYSATASQNALSDVAFLASRYAKTGETVYIPFTIYARYGSTGTGTRQLTGTVAIKIGQTMNFIDVKTTDYFYNSVKWAVGKNITNGTSSTTFSPYKSCTRAEIVTFLWRAAGSPEPTITRNPFRDVNAVTHSSYYKAILWASQKGITSGTSATAFSPDQVCTRAQIVTFLYRYAGQPSGYYSNPFKDVGATSEASYYKAILWAVGKGITTGTSATTFSPYASCNRAEAVTFLYRYTNGL